MYKLPDDITSTFLKDDTVIMICFNINQIYIHFESSIYIAIQGQYILSKDGTEQLYDVYPVSTDNELLKLLEKKVEQIKISKSREDVIIEFENGMLLNILGSDAYESYTIKINDRVIIV